MVISAWGKAIVEEIRQKTDAGNLDNISRTVLYEHFLETIRKSSGRFSLLLFQEMRDITCVTWKVNGSAAPFRLIIETFFS